MPEVSGAVLADALKRAQDAQRRVEQAAKEAAAKVKVGPPPAPPTTGTPAPKPKG